MLLLSLEDFSKALVIVTLDKNGLALLKCALNFNQIFMPRGVRHDIECRSADCDKSGKRKEVFCNAENGVPYSPDSKAESIKCSTCNQAMAIVYHANAPAILSGRGGQSRTVIQDGVTVNSPDHSVCEYGRETVGNDALASLQPGRDKSTKLFWR